MKIHIPAYEPSLECTKHLKHGEIDIDLGENVVKVVRCKDCKHCEKWNDETIICHKQRALLSMKADDYCSYGELKELGK